MGLKDLKLPSKDISVPGSGGCITVRGIALVDIVAILASRSEEVKALFDTYAGSAASGDQPEILDGTTAELGKSLLAASPDVVAEAIAHACDAPDAEGIAIAKRLPFTVQLEAIEAIGKLTFDAEGGPKKAVETVIRMLIGTTGLMEDLRVSTTGS